MLSESASHCNIANYSIYPKSGHPLLDTYTVGRVDRTYLTLT